jgi:hypothetical protein
LKELRIENEEELVKDRNQWRQVVFAAMGLNYLQNTLKKK